jgi:menaquinone-dependent protoporphyrinogen IX oxidase
MKTIVVYRSKSGFTKTYAEWIAKTAGADIKDGRQVKISDLLGYDTIVFGGALYISGINGISLIKNNLTRLEGKRVIVFTLGATPIRPETIDEIRDKNFTAQEQKQIQFFLLRGGFDFSKLTFIDKILMTLLKVKLKLIKNPTADERGMLAAYGRPADFRKEKYITPIVEAIEKP